MAKQSEKKRDLMIQRINLSDAVLQYWEDTLRRTLNVAIHKFLLTEDDIHSKFSVKSEEGERVFSLEGMTNEEFVILKEYKEDENIYWLCKFEYAQFLMGRFNKKMVYTESFDKKTKIKKFEYIETEKEYTDSQLYLPNRTPKSKKSSAEQDVDKNMERDAVGFLFDDEDGTEEGTSDLDNSSFEIDETDNFSYNEED